MNSVQKNHISNLIYRYGIEDNLDNFEKLANQINKKEYYMYRQILLLLENCKIVEENGSILKVEICSEQYRHLLDDISKKFLIKVVNRRKVGFSGNIFFTILIYIIMAAFVICHIANNLKHIALREIHYQLLNTCLIISSIGWRYYNCYEFSGCRQRSTHRNLSCERNYCLSFQIKKAYNLDKIYKIKKIQEVFKTYKNLKEDLQNFLNSGFNNFWLYD